MTKKRKKKWKKFQKFFFLIFGGKFLSFQVFDSQNCAKKLQKVLLFELTKYLGLKFKLSLIKLSKAYTAD